MHITETLELPESIYKLYANVGADWGNYTPEQAMASALIAYMDHIIQEMRTAGELTTDKIPYHKDSSSRSR